MSNMQIVAAAGVLVGLLLAPTSCFAQPSEAADADKTKLNTVYLEIGGNAGYSLNYEREVHKLFSVRLGASAYEAMGTSVFNIPALVYLNLRHRFATLKVGVGLLQQFRENWQDNLELSTLGAGSLLLQLADSTDHAFRIGVAPVPGATRKKIRWAVGIGWGF